MLSEKEKNQASKFLSLILRHKPEIIGIMLDENGWTDTEILIKKMNENGTRITQSALEEIVSTNDKKRFQFSQFNKKIRASQGHSVDIDLALKVVTPPDILFHGTGKRFLGSIMKSGLVKGRRNHVHLSDNLTTATNVGSRHDKNVVLLEIDTVSMQKQGHKFYQSDNGVWLTESVPAIFLTEIYE